MYDLPHQITDICLKAVRIFSLEPSFVKLSLCLSRKCMVLIYFNNMSLYPATLWIIYYM